MWMEPATVPPRKPSFEAVASSWIEPFTSAAELRGERNSLVQTRASATDMRVSPTFVLPKATPARSCGKAPLFAAAHAPAEADLLGKGTAPRGIGRRHHRIVGRQAPALAVVVRAHVVARAQVALQHLQLLAVFQADDEVVLDRAAH